LKNKIFLPSAFFLLLSNFVYAGSATWNLNPASNAWGTAANWTPATVPDGASDVATFDISNTTSVSTSGATVDSIVFNVSASAFAIGVSTGTLTISGTASLTTPA
jgi:hypothetical protein